MLIFRGFFIAILYILTEFNAEKNEIQLNNLKSESESTNRKRNVVDGQVNFTRQTLSSCTCQGVMELYFC